MQLHLGILLGGLTYVAGNVSADAPPAAHAADAAACMRAYVAQTPRREHYLSASRLRGQLQANRPARRKASPISPRFAASS